MTTYEYGPVEILGDEGKDVVEVSYQNTADVLCVRVNGEGLMWLGPMTGKEVARQMAQWLYSHIYNEDEAAFLREVKTYRENEGG